MNIFQRFMHWAFNYQYVLLSTVLGNRRICRVYQLGLSMYANPYASDSKTKLLPGGKTTGVSYVVGWEPVTLEFLGNQEELI